MRALLQRVCEAKVTVDSSTVGKIGVGLLVFLGIHEKDGVTEAQRLARKVLQLRIFPDEDDKMNLSVLDIKGELLVISQFTLYGDTRRGNRPSYSSAARPDHAKALYETFVTICRETNLKIETGTFQANMKVYLVNNGPVTLLCEAESY
jgi:D-tyrosyl-tRNA(Tyr) deacylase